MAAESEILFAKTLEQVKRQAREQGNILTEEQVRQAFAELSLQEEQLQLVFDYLKQHRISLGEPEASKEESGGKARLKEEAFSEGEFLSDREREYLKEYRRGLEQVPVLSEGQKEAMLYAAMAGEREAQQNLIHAYLMRVVEISRLYAGQGVLLEDLIGAGNVALTLGVGMLGAMEHAAEAEGMLVKMVMDSMEECIRENLLLTEQDQALAGHVNRVAEKARELAQELRRKVTVKELAEETGMTEEEIEDAMRMSGFTIEDLEGKKEA